MAKKETTPLIHCDACGKDYSADYRRCPVCGNRPGAIQARYEERAAASESRGGKRLADDGSAGRRTAGTTASRGTADSRSAPSRTYGQTAQGRGAAPSRRAPRPKRSAFWAFWDRVGISPVRVIGFAFTLIVIIALFLIVTKLVLPAIGRGSVDTPDNKRPSQSQSAEPSPSESPSASPSPSKPVAVDPKPTNTIPLDQTAVDFDITPKEFAISAKWPNPVKLEVKLYPAGSKGTVTFSSSDPSVIGVTEDGTVWAAGKGNATITATMPGAEPKTCKVYSSVAGGIKPDNAKPAPSTAPSAAPSTAPVGTLKMSVPEFTISDQYPHPVTLTVSGASGAVAWTSSNPGVASVDQKGKVTRIGKGRCTIIAIDAAGNRGESIVRCT